ncbi:MAG: PadR family transcriptional regulator [Cyclobacteriaceae bacterium]|nr:PadR family transcriptional regulator [Cyclobacteriaceae bacterium]
MQQTELIKGTLQTIILKLLSDHSRMYGYEITQKVREMSGGELVLTEGALYPTLHKLVAEGYLSTETENIGKRVRKYYKLTSHGNTTAVNKVDEFVDFVRVMSQILQINPQTS